MSTYQASVNPDGDINCESFQGSGQLGSNDTCLLNCNVANANIGNFDCRTAGTCIINCIAPSCLEGTYIYAANSKNLTVYATAELCMANTEIQLPSGGDAILTADTLGNSDNDMIFYSSWIEQNGNTNSLILNCVDTAQIANEECSEMDIWMGDGIYLEINIDGAEMENSQIECPKDSTYNGPSVAPCIIDATKAESTYGTSIFTNHGTPQDVIFYANSSNGGNYTQTTMECKEHSRRGSDIIGDSFIDTRCWNSPATTTTPSTSNTVNTDIVSTTIMTTPSPISSPVSSTIMLTNAPSLYQIQSVAPFTTTINGIPSTTKPRSENSAFVGNSELIIFVLSAVIVLMIITSIAYFCIKHKRKKQRQRQKHDEEMWNAQAINPANNIQMEMSMNMDPNENIKVHRVLSESQISPDHAMAVDDDMVIDTSGENMEGAKPKLVNLDSDAMYDNICIIC